MNEKEDIGEFLKTMYSCIEKIDTELQIIAHIVVQHSPELWTKVSKRLSKAGEQIATAYKLIEHMTEKEYQVEEPDIDLDFYYMELEENIFDPGNLDWGS
jgi:D-ribose pyranose/furanose isomerase RbsD